MRETVLRAIFLWLIMFVLCQPLISHADYLQDLVVKSNAEYMAQKAAVEGTVSPSLRQEVINNLKAIGFREEDIEITYDTSIKDRKQRIDITIKAKRHNLFVYMFGNLSGPTHYYAHTYIMSEYLD